MQTQTKFQYWDADLPNQSKAKLKALEIGLEKFNAVIVDRHEDKYFSGKQAWRNPILLKIKLPAGKRWFFILKTGIVLVSPPRLSIPEPLWLKSRGHKLKADHDLLRKIHRRNYRFSPDKVAGVRTYALSGETSYLEGFDFVARVLDGELDLVL